MIATVWFIPNIRFATSYTELDGILEGHVAPVFFGILSSYIKTSGVRKRTVIVRMNKSWDDTLRQLGRVPERRGIVFDEVIHIGHDSGYSKCDAQAREGEEDLEGTHCGRPRFPL